MQRSSAALARLGLRIGEPIRFRRNGTSRWVVGKVLGIEADGRELDLFLTDEERAEAGELLDAALGGETDRLTLVGLHPGASREIRRWPAERFAELGSRILDSGRARTKRRPMSDSAIFRLEKALMQLVPVVPTPAAVG